MHHARPVRHRQKPVRPRRIYHPHQNHRAQKPEPRPAHPVAIGPLETLAFYNVTSQNQSAHTAALEDIRFEAPRGETIASVCPSGAGKRTLLHIMGTLDKPTSGDVLYQGRALSSMGRKEINRIRNEEIGFVFQFYHLLPEFTALANVSMPALCNEASCKAAAIHAAEVLDTVGAA